MYEINEQLSKLERGHRTAPKPILPVVHEEQFYYALADIAEYEKSDDFGASELGEIARATLNDYHTPRHSSFYIDPHFDKDPNFHDDSDEAEWPPCKGYIAEEVPGGFRRILAVGKNASSIRLASIGFPSMPCLNP